MQNKKMKKNHFNEYGQYITMKRVAKMVLGFEIENYARSDFKAEKNIEAVLYFLVQISVVY
jgi:hypothetical protein